MQPQPDYDFIMNADHKPKKSLLPSGGSRQSRIFIVLGGALLLLVAVMIVMSILSSAGNAGKAELIKAAQQQAEIIRISKLGVERAKGSSAKNLAVTTSLSIQSDQTALLAALKSRGTKLNAAQLAGAKNQKTDTALTTAEQANKFDEVFTQTIQTELAEYQKTLKTAFNATDNQTLQQTLSDQYAHAGLLAGAKQ